MTNPTTPSPPRKPRTSLMKVAAVCCSVALVGAYVAYRSGATLLPSTKSGRVMSPTTEPATGPTAPVTALSAQERERLLMSTSKSGPVVPPAAPREPHLMSGSKSAILNEPVRDITQRSSAAQQATTWPSAQLTLQPDGSGAVQPLPKPERRVMPGSKAAVVFEQPDAARLVTTRPTTQPSTRPAFRLDD